MAGDSVSLPMHDAGTPVADRPAAVLHEAAMKTGKTWSPGSVGTAQEAERDSAGSAGPFDGLPDVGSDSKQGPECCRCDTGLSSSSDAHSCSALSIIVCEQANVRAEAVVQRHSMAANWIADLQLQPTAASQLSQCALLDLL